MIYKILPPLFVDSFFFDGEAIAILSDDLNECLRKKYRRRIEN